MLSHLHHFPLNASPASRLRSAATMKAEKCPRAPGGDTRLKPERLRPPLGLQLPVLPVTLPVLQGAAGTSGAVGACTTPKRSCSSAAAPKAAAAGTFWGLGGRGAPEAPLGRAKEAQLHTSSLFVCFTDESFLKRCASPCLPTCLRVTHCQLRAARRDPQVPPAVTPSPERDAATWGHAWVCSRGQNPQRPGRSSQGAEFRGFGQAQPEEPHRGMGSAAQPWAARGRDNLRGTGPGRAQQKRCRRAGPGWLSQSLRKRFWRAGPGNGPRSQAPRGQRLHLALTQGGRPVPPRSTQPAPPR